MVLSSGVDIDVDASILLMKKISGEKYLVKLISEEHYVFYNNLKSPDSSVEHFGDNKVGGSQNYDEEITIDFTKMQPEIQVIFIVASIHDAKINPNKLVLKTSF